jgi:hypothetical protein
VEAAGSLLECIGASVKLICVVHFTQHTLQMNLLQSLEERIIGQTLTELSFRTFLSDVHKAAERLNRQKFTYYVDVSLKVNRGSTSLCFVLTRN